MHALEPSPCPLPMPAPAAGQSLHGGGRSTRRGVPRAGDDHVEPQGVRPPLEMQHLDVAALRGVGGRQPDLDHLARGK